MKHCRMASFASETDFLKSLKVLNDFADHDWDSATPMDLEKIEEIKKHRTRLRLYSWTGMAGALLGLSGGFFLQWYSAKVDMPLNIGGRPLNSWPTFVPITFILMVLSSAFFLFLTFLINMRFPQISHPWFGVPQFDLSQGRFFLIYDSYFQQENLFSHPEKIEEIPWEI